MPATTGRPRWPPNAACACPCPLPSAKGARCPKAPRRRKANSAGRGPWLVEFVVVGVPAGEVAGIAAHRGAHLLGAAGRRVRSENKWQEAAADLAQAGS